MVPPDSRLTAAPAHQMLCGTYLLQRLLPLADLGEAREIPVSAGYFNGHPLKMHAVLCSRRLRDPDPGQLADCSRRLLKISPSMLQMLVL